MCVSLCIQILSVREKKLPPTLLGSSLRDLEIKLTKDRIAGEKMDFNHVRMEFTKKCDSKQQLELGLIYHLLMMRRLMVIDRKGLDRPVDSLLMGCW